MATLEKIRNRAVLLVIIIGLALLAFLLGDALRQGRTIFHNSRMNAIEIDGNVVKIQNYEARVSAARELLEMQSGNRGLTDEQTNQLRNQIYSTIITEYVLGKETKEIGMQVSPLETFDLVQGQFISPVILNNPMFVNPQTGVFDRVGLLQFLKSIDSKKVAQAGGEISKMRSIWDLTEREVRNYRLQEKFTNLLSKAIVANKLEVNDYLAANATSNNLSYVNQKAISVPDSIVTVTDSDIKKFYDDHKELFKTEPASKVDLIYTTIFPSKEDLEDTHKDMLTAQSELQGNNTPADVVSEFSDNNYIDAYMPLSFYNNPLFAAGFAKQIENADKGFVSEISFTDNTYTLGKLIDTKVAPDSVFVSGMIVKPEQTDSIFNLVKANPDKFSELAKANSLDTNSAQRGGEMGWMTELMASKYIGKDFSNSLFSAKVGVPFIVTTKYGKLITLVTKATTPIKKYLVAYISKKATPSNKTYTKTYNEISSFLATNKNNKGIDSLALAQGYQVHKGIMIYGAQPNLTQDIPQSRKLVRWSISNKEGSVSEIEDCGDKFVISIIRESINKGYLPLQDAAEQIRPVLLSQKKTDKLYDELKKADYKTLEAFASKADQPVDSVKFVQFGTNRIDGIGFEPSLTGAAAFAKLNTPTPVKGLAGVYLINVYQRDPNTEKKSPEVIASMLSTNVEAMVRMQAIQNLIMRADIDDNRARFY